MGCVALRPEAGCRTAGAQSGAIGTRRHSRSQRWSVLTDTPSGVAAFPAHIVVSINTMMHY